MAANLEVEQARPAEGDPDHLSQAVDGHAGLTGESKTDRRLQNAATDGMDVDHPSKNTPMAALPRLANHATDAEKGELIIQYAELFCAHIDEKFATTSNRVELLNCQVMEIVRRSRCTIIQKFHDFYALWYPKRLQDTPDVMNEIGVKLNDFEICQDWWWKRCVEVPIQSERRGFVVDVFERIKEDIGALQTYRAIDALFEEYKYS